jgi:hypothetical protein
MAKISPASFSPELVRLMKAALDIAVRRIDRSHRNTRYQGEDGTADCSNGF